MSYYGKLQSMEGTTAGKKQSTKDLLMKAHEMQQARKSDPSSSAGPALPGIMPNTVNGRRIGGPAEGPARPGAAPLSYAGPARPPAGGTDFRAIARESDYSLSPSELLRKARAEKAAAKAAGPALPLPPPPSSGEQKSKKNKKEKTKDKKDAGGAEKHKSKKKKDKKKDKAKDTSSELSSGEVQQGTRPKRYKGHFMHPSFGGTTLSISVQLHKARTTGAWVIMGQVVDSTVTVGYEEQHVVFSDGKVVLDGMFSKKGLVRGEVVMQGEGGGNFVLCPEGPDALPPEQTKELVVKDRKVESLDKDQERESKEEKSLAKHLQKMKKKKGESEEAGAIV